MNEQIKLMWEQAAQRDNLLDQTRYEKFAELIIQDIHAYVDSLDTAQIISNGILRRYGVEEQINLNNIIAGAEIMAGDGGYKLGTEEGYQEFVKKRNAL